MTVVQRNTLGDPVSNSVVSQVHNNVHSNFKRRQLITSVMLWLQEVPDPPLVHWDSERQRVMWPPLVQQPHLNLSMVGDTKYIFLWRQGSTGNHWACYLIKSMPAAKCLKTLQVTISHSFHVVWLCMVCEFAKKQLCHFCKMIDLTDGVNSCLEMWKIIVRIHLIYHTAISHICISCLVLKLNW